jgi:hypothetical protein
VGGVSSFFIYGFGLLYFSYLIFIWLSGEIPPNISQTRTFIKEDFKLEITNPIIAIQTFESQVTKYLRYNCSLLMTQTLSILLLKSLIMEKPTRF